MPVPYVFATADPSQGLPLAWLDANFAYVEAVALSVSIATDALTVTAPNTISSLSQPYNNGLFLLIVNGLTISNVGALPAFTVSGITITWSSANAGYSLATTDSVVAVYAHN